MYSVDLILLLLGFTLVPPNPKEEKIQLAFVFLTKRSFSDFLKLPHLLTKVHFPLLDDQRYPFDETFFWTFTAQFFLQKMSKSALNSLFQYFTLKEI